MTKYVVIRWPESQILHDQVWFEDEVFLINSDNGFAMFGPDAYFIPEERYKELFNTKKEEKEL